MNDAHSKAEATYTEHVGHRAFVLLDHLTGKPECQRPDGHGDELGEPREDGYLEVRKSL